MLQEYDIRKLYQKAKFEWLKPSEVLFILMNHDEDLISPAPPNRPPGGALFLFNRRVLRYFRKDGHAWRRKKDGRTIGEAHEQLKVDNVPVLSCYYAHGEENPSLQRRSYWMLDPVYEHIVLVHYRDVSEGRCLGSSSSGSSENMSSSSDGQGARDLCSYSPGYAEEVPASPALRSLELIHETLRNLEQHLISDDGDHHHGHDDHDVHDPHRALENAEPAENSINVFDYSWDGNAVLLSEDKYVEFKDDVASFFPVAPHLFSIREISPEWAFSSAESTKVIITGDFLLPNYPEMDWKVTFGDVQVPAEIIQDGVIRCQAPSHVPGRVPLYLTSGGEGESRSEVREFEFLAKPEAPGSWHSEEILLLARFTRTLLCDFSGGSTSGGDEWDRVLERLSGDGNGSSGVVNWLLQELLRDKLMRRLRESSLSREEQSVIHMVSGLGLLWALAPVLEGGVGVNFRDSKGWTALHYAAHFGREEMVSALLAAGASAGAVTDPTPQDPVGKTAASLADANGHKGLAGFLSEAALRDHLSSLTLEESEIDVGPSELPAEIAAENAFDRDKWHHAGATEDQLSLSLSLAAARNATQAAARIQAAFRAHSFRKKRENDVREARAECRLTPEEMNELSHASGIPRGHNDHGAFKAVLCIQKRYRGWRGRRSFLTLRQHAVRIQAHVRGYQTRKRYKEMLWTVGVFEKAVLRWRRRGRGLRGFNVDVQQTEEEDDEDILKVFRKQKVDAALNIAVSRVLSMVDSPEARQQYRRMVESYWLAMVEGETGGVTASDLHGNPLPLPPDDWR